MYYPNYWAQLGLHLVVTKTGLLRRCGLCRLYPINSYEDDIGSQNRKAWMRGQGKTSFIQVFAMCYQSNVKLGVCQHGH